MLCLAYIVVKMDIIVNGTSDSQGRAEPHIGLSKHEHFVVRFRQAACMLKRVIAPIAQLPEGDVIITMPHDLDTKIVCRLHNSLECVSRNTGISFDILVTAIEAIYDRLLGLFRRCYNQ